MTGHAPQLTFHASRFTFHASRFTFHASRFTFGSRLDPRAKADKNVRAPEKYELRTHVPHVPV